MADLDIIYNNSYAKLCSRKDINREAMREVFDGFLPTFNEAMNESLTQEIAKGELGVVVKEMTKGKAPGI